MHPSSVDVFVSYNRTDAEAAERLARWLQEQGLAPWLDRWSLAPGRPWQPAIAQALRSAVACAVLVGPHGLSAWAREELAVAQDRAAEDPAFSLFMVLLPDALDPFDPSLAFLSTRTWVDLRSGLDDRAGRQELLWAITGIRPPDALDDGARGDRCPYRGLESFDEEHAEFFFGRTNELRQVVEKLRGTRFLAVLGPSGSGKSSLVRAGLIPAIRAGRLPDSDRWPVRVFTPGPQPLKALGVQLARLGGSQPLQHTLDRLDSDARSLDLAVALHLSDANSADRVLLVVDQFEELFTLCRDEDERAAFVANLIYAATIPGGRTVVVLALRADFYHRCAAYSDLRAAIAAQQALVGPLTRDALREVIEQPAQRAGLELEAGLSETMLEDVAERPGALPLLEYVLLETWHRRRGRLLTLEGYVASGGVEEALARRADAVYGSLSPAQQSLAQRAFLRLIQPGEGTEDTRRRAHVPELLSDSSEQAELEAVLRTLADNRLIVVGRDASAERTIELPHEALIRGWPRLQTWISSNRELLQAQRRLGSAAVDWEESGRDESHLYHGARLAAWEDRHLDLSALEQEFLSASWEQQRRTRAAQRKRTQIVLGALTGGLALMTAIAALAVVQTRQAVNARDTARSTQLAGDAIGQLTTDPSASLATATRAYATKATSIAEGALRAAVDQAVPVITLHGITPEPRSVAFAPDGRHLAIVRRNGTVVFSDWRTRRFTQVRQPTAGLAVAFAPDSRHLATAAVDGVRVWDTQAPSKPAALLSTRPTALSFSDDGRYVATAGRDRVIRIWDWRRVDRLPVSLRDADFVFDLAFAQRGRILAAASEDGKVRVWDWRTSSSPIAVLPHPGEVSSLAFSGDGRYIATASAFVVRVWDWRAPRNAPVAREASDQIRVVALTDDGRYLAGAGDDGTVSVWDRRTADRPPTVLEYSGSIWTLKFTSDGRQLAAASDEGTARLWDWGASHPPPRTLTLAHEPRAAAFAGGRAIAIAADKDVLLWEWLHGATPRTLVRNPRFISDLAVASNGRRVATSSGGEARVWDLPNLADPAHVRHGAGELSAIDLSANGGRLAAASYNGTVRVWRLNGSSTPTVLRHRDFLNAVVFAPDGRHIATAAQDAETEVRVWDLDDTRVPAAALRLPDSVYRLDFAGDSRHVAIASRDRTLRIWDWRTPQAQPVVLRHPGQVIDVAFSQDGRHLATASDTTARVWDWREPRIPPLMLDHDQPVHSVTFGADGRWLATASGPEGPSSRRTRPAVSVWQCQGCGPLDRVRVAAARRMPHELHIGRRARASTP